MTAFIFWRYFLVTCEGNESQKQKRFKIGHHVILFISWGNSQEVIIIVYKYIYTNLIIHCTTNPLPLPPKRWKD